MNDWDDRRPQGLEPERESSVSQLAVYLMAFYPGAPEHVRKAMLQRFKRDSYRGRLPEIAGILTSNHARHAFTRYETLLKRPKESLRDEAGQKVDRRMEARRRVAKELNDIIATWCDGAPVDHPSLRKIRKRYKLIRREAKQRHPSEASVLLHRAMLKENAELAEFSRYWLIQGTLAPSKPDPDGA